MSVGRFLQQAAAGNAGANSVYVDDVFSTYLYEGNARGKGVDNGVLLGDGLSGGEATYFNWDTYISSSATPSSGATSYTVSMYIKGDANNVAQRPFSISAFGSFTLSHDRLDFNSNRHDGNGAAIVWFFQHAGKFISGRWNHILFSVSNNGSKYCYINDQQATPFAGAVYSTSPMYGIDPIVGGSSPASPTASNTFNGSLARIYVKKEYVDLSVTSNRRIFVNANLTPVSHSSLVARNPELYMPLGSNYTENLGTESHSFTAFGDGTPRLTTGVDSTVTGKGGLVWTKGRTGTVNHVLFDTERAIDQGLSTNLTNAEGLYLNAITSFNNDGYSLGSSTGVNAVQPWASWTFRKQPGFFDIVTYTGNGSPGQARTLSHNLGSVPGMIIVKSTSNTANWAVYHRKMDSSNPENYSVYLDATNARATSDYWRQQAPTDTEFTIGWDGDVNASGYEYVAYLFAHDAQEFGTDSDEAIIKCGSYTGNGSTNGPEIDLGFEAQWVLIKNTGAADWIMADNMRGMSSGGNDPYLRPNTTAAEYTSYDWIQPTASGFKLTNTGSSLNSSGGTFIYMAIRRPHKPASEFAATDLFSMDGAGSATNPVYFSNNHIVDMAIQKKPASTDSPLIFSRLTGAKYLNSTSVGTEGTGSGIAFDYMNGVVNSFNATTYQAWMFRRAPGFFDVVVYTGSSSAQEISHNLGVAPELIIQKCRTQNYPWNSWYSDLTNSQYVNLNTNAQIASSSNLWGTNATVATDSVFRTGSGNIGVDGSTSDTHIAYLFASAKGISKVGTFTRTSGDTTNVDCGFSNGARFVLFKRVIGGTGNWTVYDTVRGIVTGNDPYFFLNSSAPQVTNTDYIDPYSAGFTVASGIATGTFLFLAIA